MTDKLNNKCLKPEQLNVNKIIIDPLKVKKNGSLESKQCRISYMYDDGNKKPLLLIIPLVTVPFSVNENPRDAPPDVQKKYSIDFQLGAEHEILKTKFSEIDKINVDFILSQVLSEPSVWWGKTSKSGKPWERDHVQEAYISMVKVSEKDIYPPRLRLKLPVNNPEFRVYDQNNQVLEFKKKNAGGSIEYDWSFIKPGSQIKAVVEVEGLWEVSRKVYCTLKARQLKVYPKEGLPDNVLADDDDIDVDVQESKKEVLPKLSKGESSPGGGGVVVVVDDDGEEVEEEEEEEEEDSAGDE